MAAAYQSLPQSRGKPFFFELNTDNAVYEGYHPEPPRGLARCCCCADASSSSSAGLTGSVGAGAGAGGGQAGRCCCCPAPQHCDSLVFKDWETEALYQQYAYAFRRALLCRLLLLHCLALVAIGALDFALDLAPSRRRVAFKTLALTGLLTVHLLLFVHLNCRLMRRAHLPAVAAVSLLLVLLFVGIALPIEWSFVPRATLHAPSPLRIEADRKYAMPDGLWQVAFAVVTVYAFAPVGVFVALPFCGAISALHVVVAVLMARPNSTQDKLNEYFWRMLGSNGLVLFAANLVGLLVHRGQERILRQIFTDTRDCITNRIAYQEESDKLEQLCAVVAPEPLISDLRRDFLHMTESNTSTGGSSSGGANSSGRFPLVINHLRNVSFLSCDILPITHFPPDFAASEAVRLLNEVYGRFDQLSQEYSCFRVYMHSEQYLCICGYPDTRLDHAKSSVELAFAILELINNLSDSTELGLDIRLAVHTGDAYANLLGKTRLAFDLSGEDASIAKQLHGLCTPGRVLVSKATFDQLPDGYRAESGPLFDLAPNNRVETYYIKPRHFRSSSNLRGAGGAPRRARYTRLQALEPAQKRSGLARITQCAKFNASAPYMFLAEDMQKQCVKLRDSDEFVRKPFKRKSVTAWTVSLQRYMALTVNGPSGDNNTDASPVRSVRSLSMNPLTLRFQDHVEESAYHSSEDWTFGRCMVTALVLLLASAALQAVILPRTVLLLLLFMIAFTWIGMMLLVVLVTKLRCLEFNVQSSAAIRLVVIVTSVLFIYAVSQVNVFCCQRIANTTVPAHTRPGASASPSPPPAYGVRSTSSVTSSDLLAASESLVPSSHLSCAIPHYLPLSCVLSLLVLSAFMSLPAIGKLPLSLLIFTSYAVVTEVTHRSLFDHYDLVVMKRSGLPGHVLAMLCMALFLVFVYTQGRFMEYTMRLGHLWRSQARANLEEAERFRECSELVLKNILPEHVALYFLDNTYRNPIGLYSQEYNCLGVLCASIPTWQNGGATGGDATIHEDIRRLNDLIVQFDDLLQQEKFAPIDKVRALFSGYVTVIGVNPHCPLEDNTSKMQYLTLLVQFALSMKRLADEANAAMGVNRMKLRIGLHAGPGFCGVVGAHRPGFDLWGEAFQLAAVLERSGVLHQVHASSTVVTFTQAQYDFVEHAQVPLPSPAPPGASLASYVLCESQRGSHPAAGVLAGARLHNKRYSVPCNPAAVVQPQPALPPHSGSHSVSRSAMRAIRQNSLSVAAPLPVVPSVGTPPQPHHHRSHHQQQQQQQAAPGQQQQLPPHQEQASDQASIHEQQQFHHHHHHHHHQQQQPAQQYHQQQQQPAQYHQQQQQPAQYHQQQQQSAQYHQQQQQQPAQYHHQQQQQQPAQYHHQQQQQQQFHNAQQQQQYQNHQQQLFQDPQQPYQNQHMPAQPQPQYLTQQQYHLQQQQQQQHLYYNQPLPQPQEMPQPQPQPQYPHYPDHHQQQQRRQQQQQPVAAVAAVPQEVPIQQQQLQQQQAAAPKPSYHQHKMRRQLSSPHTPASEVAPSLPPRPCNPVACGAELLSAAAAAGPCPEAGPAVSQSSLNSFLQLEEECGSALRSEPRPSDPASPAAFAGDHYNPLYTDNEYDTDLDAAFATRSGVGPRRQSSSVQSSPLPSAGRQPGAASPATAAAALPHQLDFPDYQRPASPGGASSGLGPVAPLPPLAPLAPLPPAAPGPRVRPEPGGSETLDSAMLTQDEEAPGLMFTLSESGRGVRLKPGAGRQRARPIGDTEDELEEVEESDLDSTLGVDTHGAGLGPLDSELEAMRVQSDAGSELSEQLFVSDIEDVAGGPADRLYRFPAGNRLARHADADARPATLPDVAPVGLPDFSLLGATGDDLTQHYLRQQQQPEGEAGTDVEVEHRRLQEQQQLERERQRELAALERRRDRFKGASAARRAAASPSVRSEYDNMCSESDAGYTGDVASSAYEEDSCDDDDSDLDLSAGPFRGSGLRHSDYDNMDGAGPGAVVTSAGMMDVSVFNEQIAEEARRISHVFQQQAWNGPDTATSAGEEDEEEDEEEEEEEGETEATVAAVAAPHEDGGESPMSLPPELTKSETLVALLGAGAVDLHGPGHLHDDELPLSMTSSFSEVATTSEIGESEYDNYESDTANGELSSSSWFTGFQLHQFEPGPPSGGGTGGSGGAGHTRTTVV